VSLISFFVSEILTDALSQQVVEIFGMLHIRNLFFNQITQCACALCFFTGSIAHSAKRRYLSYSEADFEVFRPAGATRCTDGGEIWHGGGPKVPSSVPTKFGTEEVQTFSFVVNLVTASMH